ncbi:MAG: RagB/SusD family nutrient uptake outer membrane protein [Tannerellaceae bacterium]|jgi:hypothetical protein|nr:RagB/SusD family nutrient uptake outer membrane protein [Tannerellaceae bacterium]
MKNGLLIISISGSLFLMNSCSDFLDIEPKNLQTEKTAFQTYSNFATYSLGLYDVFPGANDIAFGDAKTPWLNNNTQINGNAWAYRKITEASNNSEWNFSFIRRVNIMLDNIDPSQLTDKEKAHWRSVGLFFRSYRYIRLMSLYGDVPWIEHVVTEDDVDIIYGKRDSRDVVAANILRDLLYAEQNINADGDGTNTVNVHVVRALISRFGLFEGTWRKYHGLGDAETYLNACVTMSEKLLQSFPNLHNKYEELFNSQDLTGMTGVLLFYAYELNILTHGVQRSNSRASGSTYELSKEMVGKYLCSDGRPISTSSLYDGDKSVFDEFRNRDYRLLLTVVPPSRVHKGGAPTSLEWRFLEPGETVTIGTTTLTVTDEDCAKFREYIDLLAKISKPTQKALPVIAWNNTLATNYTPRFRNFAEGIAPFSGQHGYWYYKYYDTDPPLQATNSQDFPIFRIEEAMLNYAEAKFELGQFNQDVADRTINKIRVRVNVAPMNVAEIDETFDTERDQAVSPVLWEIRRERMVELIGEDFLFNDVRRWKKGEYYNKQQKGAWVKNAEYNNVLRIEGYPTVAASKDKEGYVIYLQEPLGWLEHYYLFPIPLKELILNPELEQNPGYNSPQ